MSLCCSANARLVYPRVLQSHHSYTVLHTYVKVHLVICRIVFFEIHITKFEYIDVRKKDFKLC